MLKKIVKTLTVSLCAAALITALPFQAMAEPKTLSKTVKVGDSVYFGKYEQDGNTKNGKEKIEWQVLDKKGNKVLLMSKKVLDIQAYHKAWKDVTWEESTLRKWLNEDFVKEAFASNEKKKIQDSKIKNKDNKAEHWHTKGGNDTTDKVFLLSIDETKKYFKEDENRKGEITAYGIKRLAELWDMSESEIKEKYFAEANTWWYWLRSSGGRQCRAASVALGGGIREDGFCVFNDYEGVFPAVWVTP